MGIKLLNDYIRPALKNNEPLPWSLSRNNSDTIDTNSVGASSQRLKGVLESRSRSRDNLFPAVDMVDRGIGFFDSHMLVERWKQGGSLSSRMIHYPDPRDRSPEWAASKEWMAFRETDVSAINSSLYSGKLVEDFHTHVNGLAFGLSDLSIRDFIEVLNLLEKILSLLE